MSKKKHTGAIFTLTAIIALVMGGSAMDFDFGFGLGGNGDGQGSGNSGISSGNGENGEETPAVTPEEEPEITVTVAPTDPKVFEVIIEKDTILYNNATISSVQSLIELLCEEAGANEFYVKIHEETAIENTLEDVTNSFDKNGIVWVIAD